MISIIISFLVGATVGALAFRNNQSKAEKAIDTAKAIKSKAEDILKK